MTPPIVVLIGTAMLIPLGFALAARIVRQYEQGAPFRLGRAGAVRSDIKPNAFAINRETAGPSS